MAAILAVAVFAAGCSKPPAEQYKDYMASGQAFADESDWAAAAIQFRNAARVVPTEAEPLYQLALVELQQKKLQDAYGSAVRAARLDSDHEQAHLLLAQFEVRYGKEESIWDSAQQRLETTKTGDPLTGVENPLTSVSSTAKGRRRDETTGSRANRKSRKRVDSKQLELLSPNQDSPA